MENLVKREITISVLPSYELEMKNVSLHSKIKLNFLQLKISFLI